MDRNNKRTEITKNVHADQTKSDLDELRAFHGMSKNGLPKLNSNFSQVTHESAGNIIDQFVDTMNLRRIQFQGTSDTTAHMLDSQTEIKRSPESFQYKSEEIQSSKTPVESLQYEGPIISEVIKEMVDTFRLGLSITEAQKNTDQLNVRELVKKGEYLQYQYNYAKEEEKAKKTTDDLQGLETDFLSNNIKAVIAKSRSTIYEKCDASETYLDANQYMEHPEAWQTLQQLSEFTEVTGKSLISCLNDHKDYQKDYEVTKYLTKDKIEEFKKQQDFAEGKQKQRIENFIAMIDQESQNVKQDPIDTKFDLKLSIEEITEKYQKKINQAYKDLNDFNTLITESSDKVADCFKSYQEYQDDYKTHEGFADTRIKELEIWQGYMKGKQKQEIENFITTIKEGFQAIKQDPIDTEADMTTSIEQGIEEYNEQLIRASDELCNFSSLVTDSCDKFIDELKLTQVKELPMDILKSEIERLRPQASLFGDSTNLELHEFLPSLQMISEYGDNNYDARYNKQILEIRNNISKKYLNKTPGEKLSFPAVKNARTIIKDTLHKIGFPPDVPTNAPKE